MLLEPADVYFEAQMEHLNTQWRKNEELMNLTKDAGPSEYKSRALSLDQPIQSLGYVLFIVWGIRVSYIYNITEVGSCDWLLLYWQIFYRFLF
jgi:hypothetical protein